MLSIINAESVDSPIRKDSSNIFVTPDNHIKKQPISLKRQYPEKRFGNNRESPTFLRLPNVYENQFSYKNPFIEQRHKRISNKGGNIFDDLNQFTNKHKLVIKKKLDVDNINKNFITNNKTNASVSSISYPKLKSSFESSSYLNNINEYNIRENYHRDEDRILKYRKIPQEDYNCVVDRNLKFSPSQFEVDKWPLFYEK
jgi:hypothetical protein